MITYFRDVARVSQQGVLHNSTLIEPQQSEDMHMDSVTERAAAGNH